MKKLFSILFLFVISILNTNACLNYYYSLDKEGNLHIADDILIPFNKNFNKELNVRKLTKLEAKLKKEHSYMLLSDYSICLMKLGKQKEALEILIALYNHYPNEYKVASNLGTAYELNGKADSALKYIKRGMELNPGDHEGSEWVHVKVLETKLALMKTPSYLNDHTVLQLSEKQEQDSLIRKQISIQVRERFPFTPGPDAIMASLLVDLADCYSNTASIEYAKTVYQIAKEYYGEKSPSLDNKIKEMQKLMNKYKPIKPERHDLRPSEGMHIKLGSISYKKMMDDNDWQHYNVKWEKINTDVNSLLALVDFTKSVEEAEYSANGNSTIPTDELRRIPEKTDSVSKIDSLINSGKADKDKTEIKEKMSKSTWIYILLGIMVALGAGYFIIMKIKKP